jgi:hypothetical protein
MISQVSRAVINAKRKEARTQLKDWYVRGLFVAGTQWKASDVPQDLVECKRAHIMLKRAIKAKLMTK